jgi:Tetratricopeptide repeat
MSTGSEISRPYWLSLLAEACIESSLLDDGSALWRKRKRSLLKLKGADTTLRYIDSKANCCLGRVIPTPAEARKCFERAIEIARKQSAKSLELRATMSLARLLNEQGRRDEAHAMLADIYDWFTEGFDTSDLKEAKALLDELDV